MIEIRITNEIGNYEPKFIGPFTLRQIICVACGLVCCYLIYNITSPYLPIDVAGFLCMLPMGVAAVFGWVKPYGMRAEKFIKSVAVNILLAPTHRKYKTKNTHEQMLQALEDSTEDAGPSKQKKKQSTKKTKAKFSKRSVPEYYL